MNLEHDCFGIVTVKAPAKWLLDHTDALGTAWIRGEHGGLTLIGGVDALVDGSKVILEWGSTGSKEVSPDFPIEIAKTVFEAVSA